MLDALKLIDRELASRPFIAGESFSIADITALVAVDWMKPARLAVPEELVNLRRWRSEVGAPERGGLNGRIGRLSLKSAEFLAQLRVRCDRVGASNVWPR